MTRLNVFTEKCSRRLHLFVLEMEGETTGRSQDDPLVIELEGARNNYTGNRSISQKFKPCAIFLNSIHLIIRSQEVRLSTRINHLIKSNIPIHDCSTITRYTRQPFLATYP